MESGNWFSFIYHAYQSELYPTRIRARAIGFVYSWSRFSAIFSGFLIAFFLGRYGTVGVFGGHTDFCDARRAWDFRSVGRGDIRFEDVIVALNDIGYAGPCPPAGEEHRYLITVHYLGEASGLNDGDSGDDMVARLRTTSIASAGPSGAHSSSVARAAAPPMST